MTLQYSTPVRNGKLDAVETVIGTGAIMKIFDGSKPALPSDADAGTVLATLSLPSDWMAAASGGTKAKAGTWQDSSADNGGSADYFRIYDSGGSVCHVQGTCGLSGSGADLILDSVTFTAGQSFSITAFVLTAGNP